MKQISILIFCLFSCLWAQELIFEEHLVDNGFDGPAGIFLKEINTDNRKDIVSAAYDSGEISWWENEAGITDNWTKHYIDTLAGAIYVYVEDINSDGFNDVIVAAWDSNTIAWWENTDGSGLNWSYHEVDTSFTGAHEVFAADVNGDGFMDVLGAGAENNQIAWWENLDGNGVNWTKHTVDDSFAGARSVDAIDLIEGGYLEVIGAALLDDEVSWWEYDETNEEWLKHELLGSFDNSHKVVTCDMNNDELPDILATAFSDGILWLENNGDTPLTFTNHDIDLTFNGAVIAYPADFNDDGIMDIAGSSIGTSQVAWWENDGNNYWTKHEITPFFNNVWPLNVGDVDNDNDMDIVAGGNNANEIHWWENLKLSAQFDADPITGHTPQEVNFEDQSIGEIDSWNWDFQNDGIIDSNEQNPSFIYDTPGVYSVFLEVTAGTNITSNLKEDYIYVFDGHSALEFDGEDSSVNVPASTVPEINGAFTVEAWIYPYSYGPDANFGLGRIFDKGSVSILLSDSFPLFMDQSLVVQMMHADGTLSTSTTPATSIVLDAWQHIAVSYDGIDEVKLFVGGYNIMFHQPTAPTGNLEDNIEDDIVIGNVADLSKGFDGLIDEVRVWNIVKDQNSILANMNHYLNGYEANLIHYWRLNEGCGDFVFDETDNTMGIIQDAVWRQGLELEPVGISNNQLPTTNVQLTNYPNPFNPSTTISFSVTQTTSFATLEIFNLKGQKVRNLSPSLCHPELVEGRGKTRLNIVWNGTDENNKPVSSGIYFCKLKTESSILTRKLLLMK
jgi:PKD repeat protein